MEGNNVVCACAAIFMEELIYRGFALASQRSLASHFEHRQLQFLVGGLVGTLIGTKSKPTIIKVRSCFFVM